MVVTENPFAPHLYPNCFRGHEYAVDVVEGRVVAGRYLIGACKRYLSDIAKAETHPRWYFNPDKAERFLRLAQRFEHAIGDWKTKNLAFEPWQCWTWMNIMGFIRRSTGHRRFRLAHVEVARGNGKAQPLDSWVPTPGGFKRWDDIEVGSLLYGRDGKPCRVIGKTPVTSQRVYEVEFSDGSVIKCSGEHEWTVSTKQDRVMLRHRKSKPPKRRNRNGEIIARRLEGEYETKTMMGNLKVRGESNYSVSVAKPVIGRSVSGIPWYFIGYWLGNGSSSGAKITCHQDDLEDLKKKFKSIGLIPGKPYVNGGTKGVSLPLEGGSKFLKELNLINNKHFNLDWCFISVEERYELLRGLMDSDGSAHEDSSAHFYNGNESLVDGVQALACSLGHRATKTVNKIPENNNFSPTMTHWIVGFTPRGQEKVFYLPRKAGRQVESRGTHSYVDKRYIVDIRKTEEFSPMFCVEVDSPDNTYLTGKTFIPTHNSAVASVAALYFAFLEPGQGNQVATVATKKDQARIVLDSARVMAEKNPSFLRALDVRVLAHSIFRKKTNALVRALSADSKGQDGLNDILAVMDELHAMKREMFEVISSGMSKRPDSLMLCITTAGFNTDSVGFYQSQYAKKICLGEIDDVSSDQTFAVVYCPDANDDLFSEETWKKANPNWGVSVDPESFRAKFHKALESPEDLPGLKVKHLNIWLSEADSFFDREKFEVLGEPGLLLSQFEKKECYIGIDLASHIDLATYVMCFYDDGKYIFFDRTFLPEETFNRSHNAMYENAKARGQLIVPPGEAINYDFIRQDIETHISKHRVIEAYYDPWNATDLAQNLAHKAEMVKFGMNVGNLSEPMKQLDAAIRRGQVRHGGSQIMNWCIGNVVAKVDHNGNVFPRKNHERLKIDVAVAMIMAIAGWVTNKPDRSVYETRGVRTLRVGRK